MVFISLSLMGRGETRFRVLNIYEVTTTKWVCNSDFQYYLRFVEERKDSRNFLGDDIGYHQHIYLM